MVSFISIVPSMLFYAPLIYFLFVSFGLGASMPFVSVLVVFSAGLMYPVLSNVMKNVRWLLPLTCVAGVFILLIMANANSGYNVKHPLPTDLSYQLNVSDSVALWTSDLKSTDKFTRKFFTNKKTNTGNKNKKGMIDTAPVLPLTPPEAIIQTDTSYNGTRELTLLCSAARSDVNNMGITIDDSSLVNVNTIEINNKQCETNPGAQSLYPNSIIFYGVSNEGFMVKFTMKENKKLGIKLFDRSIGLPPIKDLTGYPNDVIPGQGFTNNTTQVEKHFVL